MYDLKSHELSLIYGVRWQNHGLFGHPSGRDAVTGPRRGAESISERAVDPAGRASTSWAPGPGLRSESRHILNRYNIYNMYIFIYNTYI